MAEIFSQTFTSLRYGGLATQSAQKWKKILATALAIGKIFGIRSDPVRKHRRGLVDILQNII